MPKITKKDLKKGKKVIKKAKGGKGSGNIDIRLNVGTGTGPRDSRLTKAEIDWARRRGIPLSAMRGFPFNYANQRRNPQLFGPSGTGGGLSGSVQHFKSPNLTEMLGTTGFSPVDVMQAAALKEQQKAAAAEARKAARQEKAAARRAQREAAREISPIERSGRSVFSPSPDRAGRSGGGPAMTVPSTSAATEAREQDRQEPALVASPLVTPARRTHIRFSSPEPSPVDPRAVSGGSMESRGGSPFVPATSTSVSSLSPDIAAASQDIDEIQAALRDAGVGGASSTSSMEMPSPEAPGAFGRSYRTPGSTTGMGSVFVSRVGMEDY